MRPTLLVTNDFPPRPGGIQAYLHSLAGHLPAENLVVYAPSWDGPDAERTGSHSAFDARQPFEVVRHPGTLMLPTADVRRRAAELVRAHGAETVWFGAAAPLALLAPAMRRAGAQRILASTHGHEVGWSMVPAARSALRRIGDTTDVVTYVSAYTRRRVASAFGPLAGLEHLPSGVDTERFRPDPAAREAVRRRHGLDDRPTVLCVSRLVPRKGQDTLVRVLPELRERVPGAALLLVGDGRYRGRIRALAEQLGVAEHVVLAGGVSWGELPAYYAAGDVFAMPARTRAGGLDVEGLGIVYLEASASGLPVVAGRSGGAPETVQDEVTGHVVAGDDRHQLVDTLASVLGDPLRATTMGRTGRQWVHQHWRWDRIAGRLSELLGQAPAGQRT
ncbi:phosphatidylinositol alpha-1,6-mannosyltransferase [Haloechinothrix alba]|uniref:phosphatidyl-myo-inositol dimannoside synthase n=1 Tax=Haloechinothrix alba TaxID=664784 RepID=A0A238WIY3_9PSEU|nr:glycosyltransferase family 4 protein [Haloechinothrix alba]SNR46283.1 phosphatidylinositol alpha-1,6-mannosyltransferase [Haloechinothrix alba]